MKLPRYVQKRVSSSGDISYRFNPPKKLIDACVVPRELYGSDLRQVRKIVAEHNKAIDKYYEERKEIVNIKNSSTFSDLINAYYQSNSFTLLRESSQEDYKYFLTVAKMSLGNKKMSKITSRMAKQSYEEWVKRGVSMANHVCTCASRVYNYAIDMEYTYVNPFSRIKRISPIKRDTVWSKKDLTNFLDTAYADFNYRNIGLIVQMAYEWCQRIGDIRMLTWNNIDFNTKKAYLKQSKRRAEVFLPISVGLLSMLEKQKKDFGFQQYVVPQIKPVRGGFIPYSMVTLSQLGRRVMKLSGLSDDLRLMDLRRTGVVEMVESGVSLPQVMSVTGHANPTSVKPYIKNTYTSANNALTTRNTAVEYNLSYVKQ